MALGAVAADLLVQIVFGGFMAGLTLLTGRRLQQGMFEMTLHPEALHAGVIAVAGRALLAVQLLMERHAGERLADGQTGAGQAADLFRFMAHRTAPGVRPGKGRVAGKAVGFQGLVPGDQFARPHHQIRIDKHQHRQGDQIDGQDDLQDSAHTQPQNKKTLMMWPRASTANTMKIGMCTLRQRVMASRVTASQNTACSTSGRDRPRN